MPRYCAASHCKNRGGQSARDQRKLSFYPYDQEKGSSQNSPQEIRREDQKETTKNVESKKVPVSLELCTPKKSSATAENPEKKTEVICSTTLSKSLQVQKLQLENREDFEADSIILDNSSQQHIRQPEPVLMAAAVQNVEAIDVHASVKVPVSCTATVLQFSDPDYLNSSLKLKNTSGSITDYSLENPNSHVVGCSVEVQPTTENAVLVNTVTQTIEQLSGSEESVIAIIVPAESPKEPEIISGSFLPIKQEFLDTEEAETDNSLHMNTYNGIEILQTEHSYCKQDIDREHLWQKISKLHSKITLLEMQEVKTLGRLRSLEALIGQLKQENLLSEEKLKIVENCFTTLEVTMIQ
ncbi:hypothetical protein CIB84_003667 [Bambusicola thoracicus]|uniref:THAP-type domain-containing protein n=1 Tax=Bambusicola thoracicus TaxID=9083 RepID=A0A2P4T895_BAMTH|nr:hypothetical protein CIB84_003667 [Bambusicola thoracicus]